MRLLLLSSLAAYAMPTLSQTTWQSYVLAPATRDVAPVSILTNSSSGVTNPQGIINQSGPTRLTASLSQALWPAGTTATGSSTHASNQGNGGATRTYVASNAIDGNTETFWNDDTANAGPDVLTIVSPSTVTLNGITIVSSIDGYIETFTVETSPDSSTWTLQTTVTGNTNLVPVVNFPKAVSFKALRITVTANEDAGKIVYTRIAEVVPGVFTGQTRWPAGSTASASSTHSPNQGNGNGDRTYDASNAIDGDSTTFWNDDNDSVYPDVLVVTAPDVFVIPGVTLISSSDGVPENFVVATSPDNVTWTNQATVTGNTAVTVLITFAKPLTVLAVRITITLDQNLGLGVFSRVAELVPGIVTPNPYIDVDFGKVVSGRLQLVIHGASSPAPQLRLATSETQQYLGFTSDFSRTGSGTDDHVPAVGGETWVDNSGCQFGSLVCADGIRAFRYVRVFLGQTSGAESESSPNGWVDISSVHVEFTPYLGTPSTYKGNFISSDTLLNKIWYSSAYTVELDTDTFSSDDVDPRNAYSSTLAGQTVIFDGAKRDRDPYGGDVAVSSLVDLISHVDTHGAVNVLLDLAKHQRSDGWIPPASISNYGLALFDYPAWWSIATTDFYRYTANTTFATASWPALKLLFDTWYPSVSDSNGLLDKTGSTYASYGDYAFLPRSGVVTYYNANYIIALRGASLLANFTGHPTEGASWYARANTVSAALAASAAWDSSKGAWKDTTTSTCYSQDAGSFASIAGVGGLSRAQSALKYFNTALNHTWGNAFIDRDDCWGSGTSTRVYGFITYPEIVARFVSGDELGALDVLRRTWSTMVNNDPKNTLWEAFGANGLISNYEQGFTSMAHGWSAGAGPALTNKVLGVEPTTPGFASYDVVPHPGDLAWANGTVPTPSGNIVVGWTKTSTVLTVNVQAPSGTVGRYGVPVGARVVLDNAVVWDGTAAVGGSGAVSDGLHVFVGGIAAGSHVITRTP